MQKTKYLTCFCHTCFYHTVYNSTYYLITKISNRIQLKSIDIDHSADIDHQDFMKIYIECTREPYSFLTIDTMLPASLPLRFRKNLFRSYRNDGN